MRVQPMKKVAIGSPHTSTTVTLGEACAVGLQGPALLNPVKPNWNVRVRNMEDSTIDD